MKSVLLTSPSILSGTAKPKRLHRLARNLLHNRLARLASGCVVLNEGGATRQFGDANSSLAASVVIRDPQCYSDIVFGGSIGAGESYMAGRWVCDDLTSLVRILVQNEDLLESMETGAAWLTRPLHELFHWVNRNTRTGSRRNISAHYDLGNEFFALWLDQNMMYSSAVFADPGMTLDEASTFKLELICRKMDLQASNHVLEIGTGWGGFAIYAATNYGCRVTTTTISQEQHDLARKRIESAGVQDRVTLLLEDYRDLQGQYDKLVSIEMIEAIGHRQFDTYFRKCSELLKPDGLMLLQTITIEDRRFERAKHAVDFIQRYIFPGSCLPSVSALTRSLARVGDMRVFDLQDIGPHYATTLRRWRKRFFERIDEVRALGYPDAFIRMWEYYLCYCEGGFLERSIGDVQMLLTKPGCRRGALRRDL